MSLLTGAHQFLIHPCIVAYCYIKLYGFPWNPLIWLCFLIHDWGYLGKSDMDGDSGKWHPLFAYHLLNQFGLTKTAKYCLFHSRTMIKLLADNNCMISRLGVADKLAIIHTPLWMYRLNEICEYIDNEKLDYDGFYPKQHWKKIVDDKCMKFVNEWKDLAYDLYQY